MDRRMFLRSALVVAGSATAFAVMGARESKAESLIDQLKNPAEALPPSAADLPAEGAQEAQYYGGRGRGWRHRRWRGRGYGYGWRRRAVVRRCWWRRSRWGQLVRVCRGW